jgi:hypothetical protein
MVFDYQRKWYYSCDIASFYIAIRDKIRYHQNNLFAHGLTLIVLSWTLGYFYACAAHTLQTDVNHFKITRSLFHNFLRPRK